MLDADADNEYLEKRSLNGRWEFRADPADQSVERRWFEPTARCLDAMDARIPGA